MQVKHVDYSKSHKAVKAYEIVGMTIAILGIAAIYYGMSKVPVPRSNAPLPVVPLLIAATPGAGIAILGTIILILTKIAEASIHSSEMTQQLLQIAIRRGEEDDTPGPSPRQGNKPTTYARSASGMARASLPDVAPVAKDDATQPVQAPRLARSKKPEKPQPLRPLGGDKPDLADGIWWRPTAM